MLSTAAAPYTKRSLSAAPRPSYWGHPLRYVSVCASVFSIDRATTSSAVSNDATKERGKTAPLFETFYDSPHERRLSSSHARGSFATFFLGRGRGENLGREAFSVSDIIVVVLRDRFEGASAGPLPCIGVSEGGGTQLRHYRMFVSPTHTLLVSSVLCPPLPPPLSCRGRLANGLNSYGMKNMSTPLPSPSVFDGLSTEACKT